MSPVRAEGRGGEGKVGVLTVTGRACESGRVHSCFCVAEARSRIWLSVCLAECVCHPGAALTRVTGHEEAVPSREGLLRVALAPWTEISGVREGEVLSDGRRAKTQSRK